MVRKASVEERRNEILETTCLVVIERGFAATRVIDVAQRLGVSTGLIHYHFDSKDHLLAEAFEFAANTDLARLDAELAKPGTAVEQLDRIFRLYTPADDDTGWLLWIDGWGEAIRSKALRRISQDLDLQWQERVEDVIRLGVEAGEMTCADPHAERVAAGRAHRRARRADGGARRRRDRVRAAGLGADRGLQRARSAGERLRVAQAVADAPYPTDHALRSIRGGTRTTAGATCL